MGLYLNPGSQNFQTALNSQIYVDKTELIAYTNSVLNSEQRFLAVSRPRRFGKTMTLNMLASYYGKGSHAGEQFAGLKICQASTFNTYANAFNVVLVTMTKFINQRRQSVATGLERLVYVLSEELRAAYPQLDFKLCEGPGDYFAVVTQQTGQQFVILIDEWDCIFREFAYDKEGQKYYLDFLRDWLKDQSFVALVYMTGILPIKKYGEHSALNMFREYSMIDAGPMAEYTGFTSEEVQWLCTNYKRDFQLCQQWYDGYKLKQKHQDDTFTTLDIYNPLSVVEVMLTNIFKDYWSKTETYEALQKYILMNYDGLKDTIIQLLVGTDCKINIDAFQNDMVTFNSKDDVLTLLIHLGYLTYDADAQTVHIPNAEIKRQFFTSVQHNKDWQQVVTAITASEELLQAILTKDAAKVADGIAKAHLETSHLQYNDENALAYTISLALYSARNYYTIVREMPAGLGFADMLFMPLPNHLDKPPLLVELKYDVCATTAIEQIKKRKYLQAVNGYHGKVLLVGIAYDKDTNSKNYKEHQCIIEEVHI